MYRIVPRVVGLYNEIINYILNYHIYIYVDLFQVIFYFVPWYITIKTPFGRICFTFPSIEQACSSVYMCIYIYYTVHSHAAKSYDSIWHPNEGLNPYFPLLVGPCVQVFSCL